MIRCRLHPGGHRSPRLLRAHQADRCRLAEPGGGCTCRRPRGPAWPELSQGYWVDQQDRWVRPWPLFRLHPASRAVARTSLSRELAARTERRQATSSRRHGTACSEAPATVAAVVSAAPPSRLAAPPAMPRSPGRQPAAALRRGRRPGADLEHPSERRRQLDAESTETPMGGWFARVLGDSVSGTCWPVAPDACSGLVGWCRSPGCVNPEAASRFSGRRAWGRRGRSSPVGVPGVRGRCTSRLGMGGVRGRRG